MRTWAISGLLAATVLGFQARAQTPATGAASAVAVAPLAEGEVRRVDRDAGKLTIRHGEIRTLDMPPMTMVFGVRERGWLEHVKAGDRIRFQAVQQGGQYLVTELEVVR